MSVNGVTLVLFAFLLRDFAIGVWAEATFVFSIFYLFVGGPLNQTEHYATPLMLSAILLSRNRYNVLAGFTLAAASTFWVPSMVVTVVPLVIFSGRRDRFILLASCASGCVAIIAIFLTMFGLGAAIELLRSWFSYEAGGYLHSSKHGYPLPFFAVRYYVPSGLALMLSLSAIFWRRESLDQIATRFALCWTVLTVAVIMAMGRPLIHYFLPLYAPFVMLLASQAVSLEAMRKRWYFSWAAAICVAMMLCFAVFDNRQVPFTTRAAAYTGDLIYKTFGSGAVAVLPWEIYLTSNAVPPSRFFLVAFNQDFAKQRDRWVRHPVVFVDTAPLSLIHVRPPSDLHFVCSSELTRPFIIYAERRMYGTNCNRT